MGAEENRVFAGQEDGSFHGRIFFRVQRGSILTSMALM
jgi:hypothetical protein